jgi:hypothetical protein
MNTRANCTAFVRAPKQAQLYQVRRNPQGSTRHAGGSIVLSSGIRPARLRNPVLSMKYNVSLASVTHRHVKRRVSQGKTRQNASETASDAKASGYIGGCDASLPSVSVQTKG